MTSQQFADAALLEHRAVMETLHRECIKQPTMQQYEAVLSSVRESMSCVISTSQSQSLSPVQS